MFPFHERPEAIAIWAGFAGAGGAIGPIASGLLLDQFWYGSIFFINVAVVVVALVSGALIMPRSKDPEEQPLDVVGSLLTIGGLGVLVFGIIEAPEAGWGSAQTIGSFLLAAALLGAFVAWERRTPAPMLPLYLFRSRGSTSGAATITLMFLAMLGFFFVITQYLQSVKGYSPLGAAVALVPAPVVLIALAPRSALLAQRFGTKQVVGTALLVATGGFLVLATLTPSSNYLQVLAGVVLLAAGIANTMPPATTAIMAALPLGRAGVGSAVNDTTREPGGALGIAVVGSVMNSVYKGNITAAVAGLPGEAVEAAEDSVVAALALVNGAATGEVLDAFTDGIRVALLVAGAVALAASLFVFWYTPKGAGHEQG